MHTNRVYLLHGLTLGPLTSPSPSPSLSPSPSPSPTALPALLQSAYDVGLSQLPHERAWTLQQRVAWMAGRRGAHEPLYTSYTHYWKTTLGMCLRFPSPPLLDR